jgi:hypothetical protein
MECLLRICRGAYLDTKQCQTFFEALSTLLEDKILPYHKRLLAGEFKMQSIQHWREKHYWTLRVNDLLESNLDSLREVYSKLTQGKGRKSLAITDFSDFIVNQCPKLEFGYRTVARCFALSKSTIIDESTDVEEYELANFLEFLECIGRLAQERFRETTYDQEWDLARKLESVLDAILGPFGLERVDPLDLNFQESDPDGDY